MQDNTADTYTKTITFDGIEIGKIIRALSNDTSYVDFIIKPGTVDDLSEEEYQERLKYIGHERTNIHAIIKKINDTPMNKE